MHEGTTSVLQNLDRLYYIAVCSSGVVQDTNSEHRCIGGTWNWERNDANQPVGVEYVSFPGSPTQQPGVRFQLQ